MGSPELPEPACGYVMTNSRKLRSGRTCALKPGHGGDHRSQFSQKVQRAEPKAPRVRKDPNIRRAERRRLRRLMTCPTCNTLYRTSGATDRCQGCVDANLRRRLQRARRKAATQGHTMEAIQPDIVERAYVSACEDCGAVVALDPEEDPPVYGTAHETQCRPYQPAPRRLFDDMPVLTLLEDEPMPRHPPDLSHRHGKAQTRGGAAQGDEILPRRGNWATELTGIGG